MNVTKEIRLPEKGDFRIILIGEGASTGRAVGVVRLVENIQQLHKLLDGEILIMPTISPDIILAAGKAKAVVTNAGGITSHGAIICRELGIPCVVATEKATKILKDGMIIEVDGLDGVVIASNNRPAYARTRNKISRGRRTRAFGNNVSTIYLKMNRRTSLSQEIYGNHDLSDIDIEKNYEWIPYRPELYWEPLASFLLSGVEMGPYAINMHIGPLYSRFNKCVLHLRLDQVHKIFQYLTDKIEKDRSYYNYLQNEFKDVKEKLDFITIEIQKERSNFCTMTSTEMLLIFKKWWDKCNNFFAYNVLIAGMANDIIFPKISVILREIYPSEKDVNERILQLASVKTGIDTVIFFNECVALVELSPKIKSLLLSNINSNDFFDIVYEFEEGRVWMQKFKIFLEKWGWMRNRLLYFEPIKKPEEMFLFLRKHLSSRARAKVEGERNTLLTEIKGLLSNEEYDKFLYYLKVGKFLQKERDNRFLYMMKSTDVIRELFLELGKRLKEMGVLYDEKDIFFLLIEEVYDLFSLPITEEKKVEISSIVANRMNALTSVSKLQFHQHPGYSPDQIPKSDDQFY